MKRRSFLAAAGGAAAGAAVWPALSALAQSAPSPLRVLVLGGTGFIGPPLLSYLSARGHSISIFTRGNRESPIAGIESLVGDRSGDLSALEGREWDVVFDNNARDYRWVQLTTELLKGKVGRYVFVSTISAYAGEILGYESVDAGRTPPIIDVGSPLAEPPADFKMGDELPYGPTKALSEQIVQAAFPDATTIVRPGFIVGPGDPTDRFTYWPVRLHRGGEILVPGDGSDPVQIIDARDLMEWTVRLAETGTSGIFNGVGPAGTLTMAEFVYGIGAVTSTPRSYTWVPIPFLREHDVSPYSDMPIWIPGDPLSAVGNSASIESGLTFRPLATIAEDTLRWHELRGEPIDFGISPEKERAVLDAWRNA